MITTITIIFFLCHPSDMHSSTAGPLARKSWKALVITVKEPMRKASAGTSPKPGGTLREAHGRRIHMITSLNYKSR